MYGGINEIEEIKAGARMPMGTISREEVIRRAKGMNDEEKKLSVMALSSDLLWAELQRRYIGAVIMLEQLQTTMKLDKYNKPYPDIKWEELIEQYTETIDMVNGARAALKMGE